MACDDDFWARYQTSWLRARLRPPHFDGVPRASEPPGTGFTQAEPWRLPEPTDLMVPKQGELFRTIFDEEDLRFPAKH